MIKKILIMGLPGSGKTTLAKVLVKKLNAVWFNGDEVRANISKDLTFKMEDRLENARRMGWLCDQVVKSGNYVVADFVCPNTEARDNFVLGGEAFKIWVNRIDKGRFEDTNRIFITPLRYDIEVTKEGTPEFWAEKIYQKIIKN